MFNDMFATAVVTLLVTIDPAGLAPLFLAVTRGMDRSQRNQVAWRAAALGFATLALFALGRTEEASTALREASEAYPRILIWLLKSQPKAPRSDGFGIEIGGDEEAWIYRQQHLGLWQRLDALEWAARTKRSRVHRAKPRSS